VTLRARTSAFLAAAGTPTEGDVLGYGDAPTLPTRAAEDAVAVAATRHGRGWWAASGDGKVAVAGDAMHRGDLAGRALGLASSRPSPPSGRRSG
jgi:hypothetical protein